MAASMAISATFSLSARSLNQSLFSSTPSSLSAKSVLSASTDSFGLSSKIHVLSLKHQDHHQSEQRYNGIIEAKKGNPPMMPVVMTPVGPLDLSSVMFRNCIIFIGQLVNSQVAQRVISQLVTLATIDEDADILIYLNCPGGSTYSILAIYDCMSWGHVEDARRQVNEAVQARHKIDRLYAAFTGQSLEKVQQYTERDRFFSTAEALEFGIIDGVLETLY